ncbi:hypothetical protein [Breoghania sp.]|uniref:hypothetical protein n=1 Tax=Breoghania sp. TaxID=2065378 RepID=UPI0029CA7951|nr:hypothetical protein [Breoghania sp.]
MELEKVIDVSAGYWVARITTLEQDVIGEWQLAEEENPDVARSLSSAIVRQLEEIKSKLSNLSILKELNADFVVKEILTVDIMASSIEVQAKDYLAMMSGITSTTTNPSTSGSGSSPLKRFLNGLLSALGSLQQWLLNILRIATTLKEWTISGGVSAGSLGLVNAELSITFGK